MSSLADVLSGAISFRSYLGDQLMHDPDGEPTSAGFKLMPRSPNIEDRRNEGEDYAVGMTKSPGDFNAVYPPSDIPGADPWGRQFEGWDPLVAAPLVTKRLNWGPGDPYWTLPK